MRPTNDQQTATAALRAKAGPDRVTLDAEGWPMIAGRLGRIEHHDGTLLAVYSRAMRKLTALLALGARRHQIVDDEYRLLFTPGLLGEVARVIRARRRRVGGRGRPRRWPGSGRSRQSAAGPDERVAQSDTARQKASAPQTRNEGC